MLLLLLASTHTPPVAGAAAPISTDDTIIWDYPPGAYVAPLRTDAIRVTILTQTDETTNLEMALWTMAQSWAQYNDTIPTNQTTNLWYTQPPKAADTIADIIYKTNLHVTNAQNISDPITGQEALLVTASNERGTWRITYDLSSRLTLHINAQVIICCGQIDVHYTLHNSTIDIGAPSAPTTPTSPPTTPHMLAILFLAILIPTIITIALLFRRYKQNIIQ